MNKYDVIVLLGTQPDPKSFEFPEQIYQCIDKTAELFKEGYTPYITTSGDQALTFSNMGIRQPFKEAEKLAELLIAKGVPKDKILLETDSQDTISNLYYLKTQIFIPRKMKKILFVVAEFRILRLKFLCKRILGDSYQIGYEPIPSKGGPSYNEPHTFKIQSKFLEPMKDGEHEWLADKFYSADMYKYWARRDRQKYAKPNK